MPFIGGGIVGLAAFVLWVFCIFDVIRSDEPLVRNLPKMIWLFLVVLIPPVGPIAWLVLGRPQTERSQSASPRQAGTEPIGPEDSPKFMSALEERKRLERWEKELRRREEKLRRAEGDGEDSGREPD